ncbi:MAG: hypothetical protein VYA61_00090 [Pseudomonadota bacterium]|nr:hypothetical protein [Pseudomonadota bacterium]
MLFFPLLLANLFPYEGKGILGLFCAFGFVWTLFPFFFRENIYFLERCFLSFDRPEDRPFTLLWIFTQFFASIFIVISVAVSVEIYLGVSWEKIGLLVVCLSMIGDGLAEPIGVRFGRIKYKTYALFTKRHYFRTVEGSLAVLVSSILVIVWFRGLFTDQQFFWALCILPLTLTLTEAISPHTWDGPFLSGVSGIAVSLILAYI